MEKTKKLKEIYDQCLLISLNSKKNNSNENFMFPNEINKNSQKSFLDFRAIDKQINQQPITTANLNPYEIVLKATKNQGNYDSEVMKQNSFRRGFIKKKKFFYSLSPKQIIFSTLARLNLRKNIRLLYSIQDFLSMNTQMKRHLILSRASTSRKEGNLANTVERKSKVFAEILICLRKLKAFYGYIPLKQLNKIFVNAKKAPGYFSKNFFSLIERRLDVVLYRSGYAKNIIAARQACLHSKVLINSKVCNIPSTQLNPGDIISFSSNFIVESTKISGNDSENISDKNLDKNLVTSSNHIEENKTNDENAIDKKILRGLSVKELKLVAFILAKPISEFIDDSNLNIKSNLFRENNNIKHLIPINKSTKKLLVLTLCNNENTNTGFITNLNNLGAVLKSGKLTKLASNKLKLLKKQQDNNKLIIRKFASKEFNSLIYPLNNILKNKLNIKMDIDFPSNLMFHNLADLSKRLGYYSPFLSLQLQKYVSYSLKNLNSALSLVNNENLDNDGSSKKSNGKVFNKLKNLTSEDLKKIVFNQFNKFLKNKPKTYKKPTNLVTHLEISPITNNIIFLYSPQKVVLPFHFDIDIILMKL